MGKKVEILIEPGTYDPSVDDKPSKHFIGVNYWIPHPALEGVSIPCDSPEEIKEYIEQGKKRIKSFGFTPVIKDLRVKATLNGY